MKRLCLFAEAGSTVIASINAVLQNWNIAIFFMLFAVLFSLKCLEYSKKESEK